MPQVYLLLETPNPTQQTITIPSQDKVLEIHTKLYPGVRCGEPASPATFQCTLKVDNAGQAGHTPAEALASARRGGRAAFNLLHQEKYLDKALTVRCRLPEPAINHHGFSSDLAFALKLVTEYCTWLAFPVIAASGVIDSAGTILPVSHIQGKLGAALEVMPAGSCLFLPQGNQADVPEVLIRYCEQHAIRLHFVAHLEDACRALGLEVRQLYRNNPFRGLEAFAAEHRSLFFGRDADIDSAIQQLRQRREESCPSLLVLGASGSGKSSFVQAGLLHELLYNPAARENLQLAQAQIRYSVFRPRLLKGQTPDPQTKTLPGGFSQRLRQTLQEHWSEALGLAVNPGFSDKTMALDRLKQALASLQAHPPAQYVTYVWVIDQLEEVFTLGWSTQEQKAFIELLVALPRQGVWVLATMGSNFYADYQQQEILLKHFQGNGQYDLLSPDRAALGSIIRAPVRLAGLRFQQRDGIGLDEQILSDTGYESSALPLLEFALSQLYTERDRKKQQLTYAAYEAMGGVQGAIGSWAQQVYEQLPPAQRTPAYLQTLIRHLTVVESLQRGSETSAGQYRVAARTLPLHSLPAAIHPLVHSLAGARLLMLEQDRRSEVLVRVTHESLLRNWPLVAQQIARDRVQLALLQQLIHEQQRWRVADGKTRHDFLIPAGVRLQQALTLEHAWGETLPASVRQYIHDSRQHVVGKRRRILLASLGLTLVAALFLEAFWWTHQHELPIASIIMLERFRLGYAPLPELVVIHEPRAFIMGEEDRAFMRLIPAARYPNFSYPPRSYPPLKPYAIGKYEITYDEFDYFVWSRQRAGDTELEYPATSKGGRGKQPAGYMTWHEANQYAQWLGKQKSTYCRLPNEQEWEYATRAGTSTGYPWGNEARDGASGKAMANCDGCGSQWDGEQTAPVGQFPPNAFGLHDMNGNIWEMTTTHWKPEPTEGEATDVQIVVRGGSFFEEPAIARSSARFSKTPTKRHYHIGFRVLCELAEN